MLADFFISIANFFIEALAGVANIALSILPPSPFQVVSNADVTNYLGYFNWVVPVNTILTITIYWLGAIAIYYVVQVILRWVKIIQ